MATSETFHRAPAIRRRAILLICAIGLLGAACGDDDSPSDAGATTRPDGATTTTEADRPVEKITLQLQSAPAGPMSFLYWARDEGLYREAGIDLEIVPGPSTQATVEAVAQGNADIGLASAVSVILGAANGQEVESIGHFFGASTFGLFVPGDEDDPALMAKGLDGKKVLSIAGGPQNVLFQAFLDKSGVDPTTVEMANVPITSLIQLYAGGEGDGLITIVPFANALIQGQRASSSVLFRDVTGVEPPDTAVVVKPEFREQNADLLHRFLSVSYEALVMQRNDPETTVAALVKAEPTLTTELALGQLNGQLPYLCPKGAEGELLGETAPEQWERPIELFREAGLIGPELDVDDVYSRQFFDSDEPVSTEEC